ncbi:uncharacterized protein LOC108242057 isoform X2 [Kryptolebias marmoratus]|uniref:uncharacterized protein LOC108242057 isoform X2 n=1 Tax=Kryptolebias marmoratus TaxID=37003 RepID=UPI0007F89111|nr:uncharacterized protein LOC108242057 isoform X2 [Kryptolebias marmoratus]
MSPQQMSVLRQPQSSIIAQKVLITHKLFLLENARNTLEEELRDFINQAYEDVHDVLGSSFPTSDFNDLAKNLDAKRQDIGKLSALLKYLTVEPKSSVQSSVRTNYFQVPKIKGSPATSAVKFGPLLQNFLMASSISKAVCVLGSSLLCQQLKLSLSSQPVVAQQLDTSSSFSDITLTTGSSCHLEPEEPRVLGEQGQPDPVCVPPAITQSCGINEGKSNILLPSIQAVFPENNNRKPLTIWERDDDVQVQHRKQTSSQLLHFLRVKAQNRGALEVTVLEWTKSKSEANNSDPPERMSPSVKTQSHQFRHVVTDDPVDELPPASSHASSGSQAPVFRAKRAEASGSLIYSCVVATETELWDVGDVFAQALEGDSVRLTSESGRCQNCPSRAENPCKNTDWNSHALQRNPEPDPRSGPAHSEALTPESVNIPRFHMRRFEETEVVVSHVVSPGSFYIQHADSLEKLQALSTRCEAVRTYAEQNCIPDIGAQVIGCFPQEGQWCRAQVTKICGVSRDNQAGDGARGEPSVKVEVKRLDYGDSSCLSLWSIKELTPQMAALPLQALQVSLANVTPVNGSHWSEEAVGWFRAMVHNRTLYARFYPQDPTVTVELFLEKGKLGAMRRGPSLSLRLAQNGHAKHANFKNAALVKRSAVQDSDWEKYLISCYAQTKK